MSTAASPAMAPPLHEGVRSTTAPSPRPALPVPMLSALLLAASVALAPADEPRWTPIVSYDEVRVEMDTARVVGRGPYSAWVRWHYLARASSPSAWDAGVRATVDLLEVDCERYAARTLSSTAYGGDGRANAAMSVDEPAAEWRALRAGTVGAEVAAHVCAAGSGRPYGTAGA